MMWGIRVLVAALMLSVPVGAARYAVLVGHSSGSDANQPLRYVSADLHRMRTVMIEACGFHADRIVTVTNESPADVLRALDTLGARLEKGADDLVLFYYSGHADSDALRLGTQRLALNTLRQAIEKVPARIRVAIFDACQSGSFARLKGGRLMEPFLFGSDRKVEGSVVLASSSANESSQESDALRGSVFTFHMVNALRGSADASGDGRITLNEAYRYAYDRTVAGTMHSPGGVQHPTYRFEIKGEGDIVLADLNAHAGGVLLDATIEGQVTILDSARTVVADVNKKQGSALLVALGRGTYTIVNRQNERVRTAHKTISKDGVQRVTRDDFRAVSANDARKGRAKGMVARDTYVGLTLGLGYRFTPQEAADDRMARDFSGYRQLGIDARPAFAEHLVQTTLGVEGWLAGRYLVGVELGHAGDGAEGGDRTTRIDPISGQTYACSLSWRTTIDMYSLSPGIGIRVARGPLRNLAFRIGLDIHHIEATVSSVYHDGLFDYQVTRRLSDDGAVTVPSLAVSYAVPLGRLLDIGIRARYRYQRDARELWKLSLSRSTNSMPERSTTYAEEGPLRFNVGGWDMRLRLSWNVGKEREP